MKAILTDIEGTTSSIAFVAEVLFPYARAHLADYVAAHASEAAPILAEVAAAEPGDPLETLLRWIDEDRKATPLKTLQGMIWADGYASGAFAGHVYPDAVAGLRRNARRTPIRRSRTRSAKHRATSCSCPTRPRRSPPLALPVCRHG